MSMLDQHLAVSCANFVQYKTDHPKLPDPKYCRRPLIVIRFCRCSGTLSRGMSLPN